MLTFPLIAGLLFKPALAFSTAAATYQAVFGALEWAISPGTAAEPVSATTLLALTGCLTVLSAMGADLMFYVHHLVLHKIPFLWKSHKVHHSAQVLTPLTDYRAHPLEILNYGMAKGIGIGIGIGIGAIEGVFNFLTGNHIGLYTILGLNGIIFFYYAFGYALRHSHTWISYGPVFSYVFVSPAQHQIHHSVAKIHWDKNFGGTFALWDWMFGTLYVPAEREELTFGLKQEDQENYVGIARLYTQPFVNNFSSPLSALVTIALALIILAFALRQVMYFFG